RVRVIDEVALRGSFSTSFKAPGIFQSFGGGTSLDQVIDPINNNATAFAAVTSVGNPDLDPEQSVNFNFGTTIRPIKGLNIDFDFWSFEFSDVITLENPQAKVSADPQGDSVVRAGSDTGPILRVLVDFVNATSVTTRGMDLSAQYQISTDFGVFVPSLTGTYILTYDIDDPNVGVIDGAGKLNFENFGTSTPQLRFNAGLAWLYDEHTLNVFVRYISGYDDVQSRNVQAGSEPPIVGVDAMTTLDAQYRFAVDSVFSSTDSLSLTIGGTNLTDAVPPRVAINGGFDSKVHDPRGRTLYAALALGF
ncbi:MAG: TonB-dependent receptor, partial [Myxococcota bacterium]